MIRSANITYDLEYDAIIAPDGKVYLPANKLADDFRAISANTPHPERTVLLEIARWLETMEERGRPETVADLAAEGKKPGILRRCWDALGYY